MTGWWFASYVALWILVVILGVLLVALARQVGVLHLRLGPRGALEIDSEGPPLGEAPEPVDVPNGHGHPVTVGGPGHPQFLLFVSPDCPVCREVLPSIPVIARGGRMTPLVIVDGETDEFQGLADPAMPVVRHVGLPSMYRVPGTPYAVVLDGLGVVRAKGTVNNLEQIEGLIDTARRREETAMAAEP